LRDSCDPVSFDELVHESASPEVRVELQRIDGALRRLNAAVRFAWILRRVEGYSLLEVADACRCSLATVKRRVAAADRRVREWVEVEPTPFCDASHDSNAPRRSVRAPARRPVRSEGSDG
jgi:DNA-directed RNA polymerase specialized sigma24 family protein